MQGGPLLLLIGNDPSSDVVAETIRRRGYVPRIVANAEAAIAEQVRAAADVVVVMLPLHGSPSDDLVRRLRELDRSGTIVVVGEDEHIRGAPDALELGADEYVVDAVGKPAELLSVIGMSLGIRQSDAMLRHLRAKDTAGSEHGSLIGRCKAMQDTLALVRQVCRRSVPGSAPPILITGETGTGKSVLAKYIHYNGARRNEAFVDVNCATIPPTLIEAELFGHERGAFTDARAQRPGLFETAHRGTLFLDEIGALPMELQPKLLTAIEDQSIRRIGGRVSIRVDVQVIAATLGNVRQLVQEGRFREDLYHRLKVVRIHLPPLRERGEDALMLAETFIAQICSRYQMPLRRLTEDARAVIADHPWPGNVRELRNEIERILLLEEGDTVDGDHFHLRPSLVPAGPAPRPPSGRPSASPPNDALEVRLPPEGASLEEIERRVLEEALKRCDGNVSAAARFLSITRQTLIYRMRKHGLGRDD